jgi:hypothetical protein
LAREAHIERSLCIFTRGYQIDLTDLGVSSVVKIELLQLNAAGIFPSQNNSILELPDAHEPFAARVAAGGGCSNETSGKPAPH